MDGLTAEVLAQFLCDALDECNVMDIGFVVLASVAGIEKDEDPGAPAVRAALDRVCHKIKQMEGVVE